MDDLLARAQAGDPSGFGLLLERYRPYLRLLAQVEIGRHLRSKLDSSDLVQETFLEAHRHFDRFEGITEGQLVCWLRQILAGRLAVQLRRYLGTQARDVRLERQLAESLDRSSVGLEALPAAPLSTPSQHADRREQKVLLARALERLPEDYRDVIVLRHLEGLTFPEVARRLERSQDSVEKLWLRGLARLRQELGEQP
jgi:RNA polymerase sigma-70 factor (ECF subfamily)